MYQLNDAVVVNLDGGILHVKLNRPSQLNALSHEVLQTLKQIFIHARQDASVKALLLAGEGKGFCAGADIKELAALSSQDGLAFARFGQDVFQHLEMLGKPSVAAIHGFAFGGGCELAMAATLRVSSNNTVFGQPEIKLGVIPGFGGTQRLARLIGKGRALDICLTGRRFSAEDAFQWGLVNALAAPEDLHNKALTTLQELIKMAPFATQSIMTVINQGYELSMDEALELEAAHFALTCATADKREGVTAFLEKRTAAFTGE